jgi:hypothetical protein
MANIIRKIKFFKEFSTNNFRKSRLKIPIQFLVLFLFYSILSKDLKSYRDTKVDNFHFHVPFKNIPKTEHRNDSTKYILFWTSWWFFENWQMGAKVLGEEYLRSIDCPVTNCIFSHDRNLLPKPTDYDALIFHVGDFIDIDDLPESRRDDQIYIMANEE